MDLSRFSTEDLVALKGNDLSSISTEGLKLLREQYPETKPVAAAAQTPVEPPTTGFTGALESSYEKMKGEGALLAGKVGLMKPEEAEAYQKGQEEKAKRFKPTEEDWTQAPVTKFKELLGGSLPYMALPLAAGAATLALPETLAAAPVLGGLSTLGSAAGFGAATAVSTGQFTGSNLARQMESGENLQDTSLLAAGAAAIPQALLDTLSSKMMPGIRQILGSAGIKLTEKSAKEVAERGILSTIGEYTAQGAKVSGVEGGTEAAQQFFERLQAGLNLNDEAARKEYYDNFLGGAILGGAIGGAGHAIERLAAKAPPQATPAPPAAPEAPQIDPDKYMAVLPQLQEAMADTGLSDTGKLASIFKSAGIDNEAEVSAYLKAATDSGEIQSIVTPIFEVKDASGKTMFRTTEESIANQSAERLNAENPGSASVAQNQVTKLVNPTEIPHGVEIQKGQFKQESSGFDIVAGDNTLLTSPTAEEAQQKVKRLAEIREKKAAEATATIEKLQKGIDKNNSAIEEMEAEGQANTPEYVALTQKTAKDNAVIQEQIDGLTEGQRSYADPLMVKPSKPESVSDTGYTVFQNDKPVAYYATRKEAEQASKVAPTSVPTQEAVAAKENLRQALLPFMQQLGLEGTALKIIDSIESAQGSGDGYYAQNLIGIALEAKNPMGALRHETIHALKELGAFTDQEWKLLESTAKKDWINRFIKGRNAQDGRSLYEAYKAIYLDDKGSLEGFDDYITEEAIADAFKYFNANGVPVSAIGAIFRKIKAFLESLGNGFSGLGFQTSDQVFKRVEMGKMRPTRAAPTGNAPRYQLEEAKEEGKAPAITTAVAEAPAAVAATKRAKPTKVMSMEDLGKVIPASERVVSKNPSRLLNGKKFSKANLNSVGEGFLIYKEYGNSDAEGLVKKIWEDSIADVEDFVSGSKEGAFIKDLVKSLGAKPPTAKFLNDSFSLSDSARYWYETSAEALDQTTLNTKNKDLLINLISATSQNVPPLPNMRRGISVMSEYLQNKPIETDLISKKPVADAISNRDIQTLKFGNFADTMKFINGYTKNPPVSTNDRQVAAIFNMEPDEFAKNPVLYAIVSKFYAKIRDSQNEMQGEGKQPYESWQIQALNWVEERGNNTSYGTKTADSYDQAIEVITEQLNSAGIPLEKGKIGMSTLLDPRVPNLLSGTMDVFQDALKATVESNTLLNKSGSEANQEYEKIKNIDEPWARNLRKEFLMIQTRVLKKLSSSGAIENVAKLATGQNIKGFEMSRMDANARGTFEGNLSPNIRIPMFYRKGATKKLITDAETNFILSALGSGLDQAAMAGSLFKLDNNGETYRVFLPDRKITDDEATTFEKNVGFPLNLYDAPNGAVVEINIGGYDTRPTAASVQSALNATFGKNVKATMAKAAYKSTYLTKEKVEYAPSYREVIYDYRDSKFGRSDKNGFRRAFNDRLAKVAKQLLAIAKERDGQFEEFTKDSREKRTAYEQKVVKKPAVTKGKKKYQLTAARIDVDGVMRPTRNNKGSLIASTEEAIRNFWRWFGDSGVVDDKGYPRLVLHGTARDFEEFTPKQAEAIFFTDNPKFADNYSKQLSINYMVDNFRDFLTDEQIESAKAETLRFMDNTEKEYYRLTQKSSPEEFAEINEWELAVKSRLPSGPNTMPIYVKMDNPFDYENKAQVEAVVDKLLGSKTKIKFDQDVRALPPNPLSRDDLVRMIHGDKSKEGKAARGGFWPLIENNQVVAAIQSLGFDGISMWEDGVKNYAVFKPTQVKSAVGNLGTFDEKNPNIRYSLRDDFDANFGQAGYAALNRATYKREEQGVAQRMAEAVSPQSRSAFRQHYINKYESVERLSKLVAQRFGKAELLADVSANAAALQSDRAAGVAAEAFLHGIPVYEKGYVKVSDMNGQVKGLIPILTPLLEKYKDPLILQMFQFYSATRRGIRLYKEGRENVLTTTDFAMGDKLEIQYPEFKTAFAEYQAFNKGLVKFLVDTGVLSQEMGVQWTKYGDYLPFYRQIDGVNTAGPKMFSNLSGVKPTPELVGGDKQIGDYLETVVRNTRSAIEQGMKNVAAQRVVRDIMRLNSPGLNDMGRKLSPHEKGGPDVVTVRENGQDVRYEVADPLLVESMKSLHNMGISAFWKALSYPTKALRELVTKDPGFMLANLTRDSMQSWVTSGVSMTPIVDTFKQFGNVLLNLSPEAKALRAAGIGSGYEFSGDVKSSAEAVAKALNERAGIKTGWQKALWPLSKVWDALDKGSNASDLATRAEIYKKVLAQTGNEAEAIHQSLEVMNFGRMGSSPMIQVISAIVPFFNARVQGVDVLYRAGFGKMASANSAAQQKAFITRASYILGLTVMYWMLASESDEWKRASKETRDNYWIIGKVKIPIPFEIGVLFKVAPERLLEYAFGNDTGSDLVEAAVRNIGSTLKVVPIPQAFLPVVEEVANYSFFTGQAIVGRGMENVAAPFQQGAGTSELAKQIGEALGLSPLRVDHIISGYTGTMGTYAASMMGAVINTVSGNEATRPAMGMEQIPILKRFFASDKSGGTIDAFYSLKKQVDEVVRTQHELQTRGNPDQYVEYMEKNGQLLGVKQLVSNIDKQLTNLRNMRNMINFSKIDPDDKREALNNIREAENQITSQVREIRKQLTQ